MRVLFHYYLLLPAALGAPLFSNDNTTYLAPSCDATTTYQPPPISDLVAGYAALIGAYTPALDDLVASDFRDTSGSINALAGLPLNATTFASKAAFLANQASQPAIPLVVQGAPLVVVAEGGALGLLGVVVRWTQTFAAAAGVEAQPVKGISVLGFVCEEERWRLARVETEFNSLVYLEDAGGSCSL